MSPRELDTQRDLNIMYFHPSEIDSIRGLSVDVLCIERFEEFSEFEKEAIKSIRPNLIVTTTV